MKKIFLSFLLLFSAPVMAGISEGINYFDNQQYAQALTEFKPQADKGNGQAQYYVAYMYLNGFGVIKDEKVGMQYLKNAVDQENGKAISLLAYLHSVGKIVELNKKKALELYLKAAEQEEDDAFLNLGVMYYTADGVPQDTEKAILYLEKVDLEDYPIVGRYMADIYQFQKGDENQKKAKELYKLAASKGDLGSFHSLATIAYEGQSGVQNIEETINYYTYAASQGYAPSQYALGILYDNGSGSNIVKDIILAYAWFTLAANQGLSPAIQAQKQLEETLTFSELDRARKKVADLQETVIGKIESPLKDFKLTNPELKKKHDKKGGRRSGRRRPK